MTRRKPSSLSPTERAFRTMLKWYRQHKTWRFSGRDVSVWMEFELAYEREMEKKRRQR